MTRRMEVMTTHRTVPPVQSGAVMDSEMNESTTLKAIETRYNGYHFRSRLEARWAVFYNALGIKYLYEPQGFELPSGRYLPDFYLPDLEYWIEIKGAELPNMPNKYHELSEATGKKMFLFYGDVYQLDRRDCNNSAELFNNWGWDCPYMWCECPKCGRVGIEFDGRAARLCQCYPPPEDKMYNTDSPRLLAAYKAARSARFVDSETAE